MANILYRQARSLHRGQDHSLMISVPAVIHFKILGLIAWHYYDCTVRFIQSVQKLTMRLVSHGRWNVAGNWRGFNSSLHDRRNL